MLPIALATRGACSRAIRAGDDGLVFGWSVDVAQLQLGLGVSLLECLHCWRSRSAGDRHDMSEVFG
uniref:Uncharacterized protein n=1 Tax=Triticum urartu TaxID=4572 RepID=A0A8R7QJJ9_TRIUA